MQQSHEHEHQQYSTTKLHVLLRRALSHGRDSGKHALSFRTRLGQQQEQATSEGKVSVRGERTVIFGQCPSDLQSVKQDNAWSTECIEYNQVFVRQISVAKSADGRLHVLFKNLFFSLSLLNGNE